jgi:hypothetical protein
MLTVSCSSTKKKWEDFKVGDCAKYQFGRIEAKRLLTDVEKNELAKQGIQIQEFVFETQYLGSWEHKWASRNLDKIPVKTLIPFSLQDKLASGMQLSELKKLSESPGESMVLIQTIASVNKTELNQFGKLIFSRDHFYRMVVPHHQLYNLLEFQCLRLLSIVKENYNPDN